MASTPTQPWQARQHSRGKHANTAAAETLAQQRQKLLHSSGTHSNTAVTGSLAEQRQTFEKNSGRHPDTAATSTPTQQRQTLQHSSNHSNTAAAAAQMHNNAGHSNKHDGGIYSSPDDDSSGRHPTVAGADFLRPLSKRLKGRYHLMFPRILDSSRTASRAQKKSPEEWKNGRIRFFDFSDF